MFGAFAVTTCPNGYFIDRETDVFQSTGERVVFAGGPDCKDAARPQRSLRRF
jgi:hypothetical protein